MIFPERIFFSGVPGSHWSGIAQDLEKLKGINTSDHNDSREYHCVSYAGHKGSYFGKEMEFASDLESLTKPQMIELLSSPWEDPNGTKILKSHEWSLKLPFIKENFPDDWIMLVYRPDLASYAWWHEAGGFNINYPSYTAYQNSETMMGEIAKQNKQMLAFACQYDTTWNYFTDKWIKETFGQEIEVKTKFNDILVTIIK